MKFTKHDYHPLHVCCFGAEIPGAIKHKYPGYKPEVVEAPNGDGKIDAQKRYAHVALKYQHPVPEVQNLLDGYLMRAHRLALVVAKQLGAPEAFMPKLEYGALRVLEYPPGAGGHEHTDFDLFTLNLWRSEPARLAVAEGFDRGGVHLGELGELIGLGKATSHHVEPSDVRQCSIVYFAIPDWNAKLPNNWHRGRDGLMADRVTVGEWLAERISRSRYAA